jgi:hypothetical protein
MSAHRTLARLAAAAGLLAFAAAGPTSLAATQMFKCIIGGRTVYQQQACPADADPPKAAASAGVASNASSSASAAAPSPGAAPRKPRPAEHPASSVPATPR